MPAVDRPGAQPSAAAVTGTATRDRLLLLPGGADGYRRRKKRRRLLAATAAAAIAGFSAGWLLSGLPGPGAARTVPSKPAPVGLPVGPDSGRPFATTSAFNLPVPPSPRIDPRSAAMVAALAQGRQPAVADIGAYGVPIWDAFATTPTALIRCSSDAVPSRCLLDGQRVPMPADAKPSSGSDHAMVVIDWTTDTAYEYWRAGETSPGVWTVTSANTVSLEGPGTPSSSVGAGVSRLAGVVLLHELEQGRIDHALVFSTDNACGSYRYPASESDGASRRADCIPEGARLQLDPSINVQRLRGLTPAERIVATALQRYGAYAIDNGGANMAVIFQTPAGSLDPYPALGLKGDYASLSHIPLSRLRVLTSFNGR